MLGNDVVDLADREAAPSATHPRFEDRVFTASERESIAASARPNEIRWTLWASKESAFKAARKIDPHIVFSPRRFEVEATAADQGTVSHDGARWHVRMERRDDAVHVVAIAEEAGGMEPLAGFARLASPSEDPSRAVRHLAVREIAAHLVIDAARLAIVRCGRIPVLTLDAEPTRDELSLSHHGSVVGFAALLVPRGAS
jgi:phosphopantetheinyl transferase (holo-ACP synthase)